MDVVHQNVGGPDRILLLSAVGMYSWHWNICLGSRAPLATGHQAQTIEMSYLLQEPHASYFDLQDACNAPSLSIGRHSSDGWHSKPDDPADSIDELNTAYHIKMTNRVSVDDFAFCAVAQLGSD